jgi:hypothetical protein
MKNIFRKSFDPKNMIFAKKIMIFQLFLNFFSEIYKMNLSAHFPALFRKCVGSGRMKNRGQLQNLIGQP